MIDSAVIKEESKVVRYRLDLEYDGTNFAGWQLQPNLRTIQGCLESAIKQLFGEKVSVISAGRTDAGVHALGQVAHLTVSNKRPAEVVTNALNSLLPPDIRIKSTSIVNLDFHARFSAFWRGYRYRIAVQPIAIGRAYTWICPFRLNPESMRIAAEFIKGEHVFKAFAHENPEEKHYLSSVYRADWVECNPYLEFHIEANRFLHGMVRMLVGTFVDVGRGKKSPEQISEILQSENIRYSGPKIGAAGLTLMSVGYEAWISKTRPYDSRVLQR